MSIPWPALGAAARAALILTVLAGSLFVLRLLGDGSPSQTEQPSASGSIAERPPRIQWRPFSSSGAAHEK